MSPKVSIIMPVYNTEKYLREALDTVLAQTMTDIEVLCVDDGSTDSSLEILNEYAAKDTRLTVYTQDHLFAGAARNLGIKHATGKYLLFLDSDDIFDPQMVEKSYKRAEETDADICVFGAELYFEDSGKRVPKTNFCRVDLCPKEVFSSADCPNEIFFFTTANPWNKLFRRDFITGEGIEYQTVRSNDDVSFVLTALACAKRISYLDEMLVIYRQQSGSQTHNQHEAPLTFYDAILELRSCLIKRGLYEPLKHAFTARAATLCYGNFERMSTGKSFLACYNCIREKAIPEFELDTLPEWTSEDYIYTGLREIQQHTPPEYIALHGPGLRDLIKWKDPVLTAQVIHERIKLLFKKDQA